MLWCGLWEERIRIPIRRSILKEMLILCQKLDKYRGIISKYLNNQYGFDTDQLEQMPVPPERALRLQQLYSHASAEWLNVSSAYKWCNILIV